MRLPKKNVLRKIAFNTNILHIKSSIKPNEPISPLNENLTSIKFKKNKNKTISN